MNEPDQAVQSVPDINIYNISSQRNQLHESIIVGPNSHSSRSGLKRCNSVPSTSADYNQENNESRSGLSNRTQLNRFLSTELYPESGKYKTNSSYDNGGSIDKNTQRQHSTQQQSQRSINGPERRKDEELKFSEKYALQLPEERDAMLENMETSSDTVNGYIYGRCREFEDFYPLSHEDVGHIMDGTFEDVKQQLKNIMQFWMKNRRNGVIGSWFREGHFRLLYVDFELEKVTLIDPLGIDNVEKLCKIPRNLLNSEQIKKLAKAVFRNAQQNIELKNLDQQSARRQINFPKFSTLKVEHSKQRDDKSCGPIVMHFCKMIQQKNVHECLFDETQIGVRVLRMQIWKELVSMAYDSEDRCHTCGQRWCLEEQNGSAMRMQICYLCDKMKSRCVSVSKDVKLICDDCLWPAYVLEGIKIFKSQYATI